MIRARFPDFEHRFLETHDLLEKTPTDLGLPPFRGDRGVRDIVAAWSMGSLLTHLWIGQSVWPAELPLLSLCPIFRFLRPAGFGEPTLLRMEQKLISDRETVMLDFWRRMPKAGEIPAMWEEHWLTGTRNYSDDELVQGLEYLRNTVVDTASLRSLPDRWELLAGDRDLLAPNLGMENLPSGALHRVYAGGHLPFWECPEEIHAGLRRLTLS